MKKYLVVALVLALIAPTSVMAADGQSKVTKGTKTYQKVRATSEKSAAPTTAADFANIAPAAGGDTTVAPSAQDDAYHKEMRLPRKK